MDLIHFRHKIEIPASEESINYINQYKTFWAWKIDVEQKSYSHILDSEHKEETSRRLLEILPSWQTYRGVQCSYRSVLPITLSEIAHAYNEIRQYSLLEFNEVPDEPLRLLWEAFGLLKEPSGRRRVNLDYFIISVCKPLMFLWGQTLAFDSRNRKNIRKDNSIQLRNYIPAASRWTYSNWKTVMQGLQRELLQKLDIIDFCQSHSYSIFGSNSIVPYGRFLDIYYYY